MSTVKNKNGHPVAGIILGIMGIAVALLTTLLFGAAAGAAAGILGIGAALLGIGALKAGRRGIGAIIAGALAIVLAITMTFTSVSSLKQLRDAAAASGVAPTFARYMDNPYLGLSSVLANALKDSEDPEAVRTIEKELEALKQLAANEDAPAAEIAAVSG